MCVVEAKFITFEAETLSLPFQKYFQKERGLLRSWKSGLRDSVTKYGKLNNRGKSNIPEVNGTMLRRKLPCWRRDRKIPCILVIYSHFLRGVTAPTTVGRPLRKDERSSYHQELIGARFGGWRQVGKHKVRWKDDVCRKIVHVLDVTELGGDSKGERSLE